MNVDRLRSAESIRTLAHTIRSLNIDIACIQETHNDRIDTQIIGGYKIFYGGCNTKQNNNAPKSSENKTEDKIPFQSVVAIAIKANLTNFILNITRINGRIMELRLQTGKLTKNLSIINTYEPDINYEFNEISDRWDKLNNYMQNQPKKLIKCWRTDNNGQPKQTNKHKQTCYWKMGTN